MRLFPNLQRSKLIDYLIEFIIVLAGVYFGMILSDWSHEAQTVKDRNKALEGIRNELMVNKEEVEKLDASRDPFIKTYDSLKSTLTSEKLDEKFFDQPLSIRLPNWRGIGSFNPRHSIFDAAKSSDVFIGMDLELLGQISQAYNYQKDIYEIRNLYLEKFLNFNSETEYKEAVILIDQIRQDLWGSQYLLIAKYEKVIGLIDEELDR